MLPPGSDTPSWDKKFLGQSRIEGPSAENRRGRTQLAGKQRL
jgi:hypothetical protein